MLVDASSNCSAPQGCTGAFFHPGDGLEKREASQGSVCWPHYSLDLRQAVGPAAQQPSKPTTSVTHGSPLPLPSWKAKILPSGRGLSVLRPPLPGAVALLCFWVRAGHLSCLGHCVCLSLHTSGAQCWPCRGTARQGRREQIASGAELRIKRPGFEPHNYHLPQAAHHFPPLHAAVAAHSYMSGSRQRAAPGCSRRYCRLSEALTFLSSPLR